ncbi:MAG: DivIVA domain-containing protein [Bacilli bacterium]|nr:DivIVA domain-containing protein [Bacilli bacterium]
MDKFHLETNGYSRSEVNKFIDDVIANTESMIKRVKTQQVEINNLKEELVRYKRMEETLKGSMYKAEEASTNIKKQAMDEGKIIVEEARKNASRIVNDALLRAERIELKADVLERNVRIFKRKLKSVIEQQLAVVEEIEILDLED